MMTVIRPGWVGLGEEGGGREEGGVNGPWSLSVAT